MGTTIVFRRGSTFPSQGSGITLAEPVFNTNLNTFHIGLGHGVTAEWVGAPISGLSADIAAGITYKIPTAAAVKNYQLYAGGRQTIGFCVSIAHAQHVCNPCQKVVSVCQAGRLSCLFLPNRVGCR